MRRFIIKTFYHPVLFFFLLPVFYLALGSVFSLQYNNLNVLSLLAFYLFVFINQMLENMFLRIPTDNIELSKKFVLGLESINALILLYFALRHSWLAALVLLFFTLIIQLQFLFSYYDLDQLSVVITNFFKVILLNGFAFYISTNFIHTRFIPYYLGLFLPFYFYEAARLSREMKVKTLAALLAVSYLLAGVLLWEHLSWMSFSLLLSLPFAWVMVAEYNRKTAAIYAIAFSMLYIALIIFSF